ncbi:MAG: dihydrofolate reductase [Myxococcota bacterium]
MRVSLVVAISENGVIGAGGAIPWRLPDDQQIFKRLTLGHCILMGRKTHESIGRLLPERTTIVLSRTPDYAVEGARVATDLESALEMAVALGEDELFVVGGERVYEGALPRADRLYLTRVHAEVEGDILMPDLDDPAELGFERMTSESYDRDARNEHAFTFESWHRRP